MPFSQLTGPWLIVDSGVQTGSRNMSVDRGALDAMVRGVHSTPILRFFQWQEPSITYGYLMDPIDVRGWSKDNGKLPIVRRPTGGGAVIHTPSDLSLSLLWPRNQKWFSSKPRECYAEIHAALRKGIKAYMGESVATLYSPNSSNDGCATPPLVNGNADSAARQKFSVCFEAPVCNDVMLGDRKIVGGALRITQRAMLYQGTVQIRRMMSADKMRSCLKAALQDHLELPR